MSLRSLEISGFKSFAKRALLEFKTPVTAIVGPNGSGKSNVSEAIQFVLGEQSVKSMRGKRTEDLIWNGADAAPRGNRASVKLVFDNSKRLLNVDFDEVTVERVIYRDASSEYFLNGSAARLRDIHELLVKAHLSHGGYHIISQGEADRILSAPARERRELMEDALGLKIYQWKRAESEKKLEQTEENIKQGESLRKEIAPHLSFLKKQAEKIEKAKEQKTELAVLYREYFAREAHAIEAERKAIEEKTGKRAMAGVEKELQVARNAASSHSSIPFAEVEKLAEQIEATTELKEAQKLARSFVEKHRGAPSEEAEALARAAKLLEEKEKLLVAEVRAELERRENNFKRELHEAAIVAGRNAILYENEKNIQPESESASAERRRKIERLKIRIEDSGTSGAEDVLKEYKETSDREAFLAGEIADLEKSAASLRLLIDELQEKLETEFREGLAKINTEFQKLFTIMFGGGSAKVVAVKIQARKKKSDDESDESENETEAFLRAQEAENEEEETGIEIEVSIPRKKIKGLMMLSGGERALTSIALIFALSSVKPPPFIVLDETDAALDEANSKKYGDMIENLSKHSHLVLITHNRETMSRAGVLYGITMERGASRLLSLEFDEAASVVK
jgi:chromosome segregation ATPase